MFGVDIGSATCSEPSKREILIISDPPTCPHHNVCFEIPFSHPFPADSHEFLMTVMERSEGGVAVDGPNQTAGDGYYVGRFAQMMQQQQRWRNSSMFSEAARLSSYTSWPVTFLPPDRMAAAAFYYTGRADVVRCPFCDVEVMNWEQGDDPLLDHRKWKPSCLFVNNPSASGNVPLSQSSNPPQTTGLGGGYDTCGPRALTGVDPLTSDLPGVLPKVSKPCFPDYASLEARQRTFDSWPRSLKVKPKPLSEAGFYYTGKGDQTICFYCGGGLKDWEDSDEPWTEHAKWFSRCHFVILSKGQAFVNDALQQQSHDKQSDVASSGQVHPTSLHQPPVADEGEESGGAERDATLCKVCYSEPLGVVFIPCGHLMACTSCAFRLNTCGVCRKPIESVLRTFLT